MRPKSSNMVRNIQTADSYNFEAAARRTANTDVRSKKAEVSGEPKESKMNSRFKILGLLVEKKTRENKRIEEMLKVLKDKKIKDEEFHKKIRKNFFVLREIRKEIDKNFKTLNTEYNLNNYILVKKLEKALLANCPCYQKQSENQCFNLQDERDPNNFDEQSSPLPKDDVLENDNSMSLLRSEATDNSIIESSKFDSNYESAKTNNEQRNNLSSPQASINPSFFKLNSRNLSAERKGGW